MTKLFSRMLALVLAMAALFAFSASAEDNTVYISTDVLDEMGFTSATSIVSSEDNRTLFALAATFDILLADEQPEFFSSIVANSVSYDTIYVSIGDGTVNLHWFDETGCLTFLYYIAEDGDALGGFFFFEAENAHESAEMFMETCLTQGSVTAYYPLDTVSYSDTLIELLTNLQA